MNTGEILPPSLLDEKFGEFSRLEFDTRRRVQLECRLYAMWMGLGWEMCPACEV
jgi:hypothetical protein